MRQEAETRNSVRCQRTGRRWVARKVDPGVGKPGQSQVTEPPFQRAASTANKTCTVRGIVGKLIRNMVDRKRNERFHSIPGKGWERGVCVCVCVFRPFDWNIRVRINFPRFVSLFRLLPFISFVSFARNLRKDRLEWERQRLFFSRYCIFDYKFILVIKHIDGSNLPLYRKSR